MKMYTLRFRRIDRDIYEAIRTGKKKVETRAATKRYRVIQKGDAIRFVCGSYACTKRVKQVHFFASVRRLLRKYTFRKIHPFVASQEELYGMYGSFPGYRAKIKRYGLVALELE